MKITTKESLIAERRKAGVEHEVQNIVAGQMQPVLRIKLGSEPREIVTGQMSVPSDIYDFIRKSLIDITRGREANPLLYRPIYETIADSTLTELIDVQELIGARLAFTKVKEGESVMMGDFKTGVKGSARLEIFGTGYPITKRMELFNKMFQMEQLNRAVGIAHNAHLNDVYLGPLIAYNYQTAQKTTAQGEATDDIRVKIYKTLLKAGKDCLDRKHWLSKKPLKPSILLCNSATAYDLEDVLRSDLTDKGTIFRNRLSWIKEVIVYDGETIEVGEKTFTYPGVPDGKAILVEPKYGFKELIKQDLRAETQAGDIKSLVSQEKVWWYCIGVIADPATYCHLVELPS